VPWPVIHQLQTLANRLAPRAVPLLAFGMHCCSPRWHGICDNSSTAAGTALIGPVLESSMWVDVMVHGRE